MGPKTAISMLFGAILGKLCPLSAKGSAFVKAVQASMLIIVSEASAHVFFWYCQIPASCFHAMHRYGMLADLA